LLFVNLFIFGGKIAAAEYNDRGRIMKFGSIVLLIVVAIGLAACAGNRREPVFDEADLRWALFVSPQDAEAESGIYDLALAWVGPSEDYPAPKAFSVQFGTVSTGLQASWGAWFGEVELVPGRDYRVRLIADDNVLYEGSLRIAFNAVANFPQAIDPSRPVTLTWGLNGDNQGQVAVLSAELAGGDASDEAQQTLSPEVRSWTFPAQAVQNLGYGAEYTLELIQVCRTGNSRVIIQSLQTTAWTYAP